MCEDWPSRTDRTVQDYHNLHASRGRAEALATEYKRLTPCVRVSRGGPLNLTNPMNLTNPTNPTNLRTYVFL